MAKLTVVEREQLETLFDMSGGYVLNFSNRTFAEFFADKLGIDIYDDRYRHQTGSKANRLRGFLKVESDELAGRLIESMIDYAESVTKDADQTLISTCRAVASRLRGTAPSSTAAGTTVHRVEPPIHVFVSYSWDSDAHKEWVRKLADELAKNGISITLDQYDLRIGDDRFQFMEQSVRHATAVLCVCTPTYVAKANDRTSGVGVETSLITPQFFERMNLEKQFIPIVRETESETPPTPDYMSALIFVDFRDDSKFRLQIEQLVRHLHDEPEFEKPPVGPKPTFEKRDQDKAGAPSDKDADFEYIVRYFQSCGVNDPDVDLFVASMSGDESDAESAIARGGNMLVTGTEIVSRHKELLRENFEAFRRALLSGLITVKTTSSDANDA